MTEKGKLQVVEGHRVCEGDDYGTADGVFLGKLGEPTAYLVQTGDLLQKSSYRNYWQNRCLVVVDGFFEPHVVDPKKPSQSYYIRNFENEPLTLGGIYSVYQGKGTFAILTTEANDQMKRVHNEGQRMPVILDDRHRDAWLSPELSLDEMMALCKPYDQDLMDFRTIDGVFNSRANTDLPEAIMPRIEDPMI
jgi:putative SOS response-associated peptidase YedK